MAVRRKRTYINFDKDWRRDFTISVKKRHRRAFEKAGVALPALAGKRVRLRGWIKKWKGPFIEATHSEQIEILR